MKQTRRLYVFLRKSAMVFTLLVGLGASGSVRAERLRIVVGDPNFRPYPVAVPDLGIVASGAPTVAVLAQQITSLLQADVGLARSLELVAPQTYLGHEQESWSSPVYANWRNVGASGLVRGVVEGTSAHAKLTLGFYDVAAQRRVLSKTCQADTNPADIPMRGPAEFSRIPAHVVSCVHGFLDEVVALLTHEKGIFSSRLVFVQNSKTGKEIATCSPDGTQLEMLTHNGVLNVLPAWHSGGQFVFFTSYLKGHADLYRMRLSDKSMVPVSRQRGVNMGASVSPDGKRVALTLSKDGNTEIYTMDVHGQNATRLTNSWGQDVSPTWSPDGKRIAFVSSRSGHPHIYVMNADGTNPRRLTFQGTYNQEPNWSPRPGGHIVFTARDENLKYDIFLVHPDSGKLTRLTQDEGQNESPAYSPDGYHVVFTSSRGGSYHSKQLWIMNADGTNPRRIPMPAGTYETPHWGPRLGYPS